MSAATVVAAKAGLDVVLQFRDIGSSRRALFLIVAITAATAFLFTDNAATAEPKRVLIVHSFGSAAPPFTVHSTAFESELVAKLGERVDLDEVSLDMARYADLDMQEAIVDYLEKRQAKWKPDLVVPIGSPAAIFVATFRDRLFPDAPVLYTSLDRRLLPAGALEKNAAYIGQQFQIPGLIEDMLQMAPGTKNIDVVVGATPLEHYWQDAFQKAAEPFASRIKFTYYSDLSFDQMLERAAKLPADSFIFFLLLLRDAAGVTINADEALQNLRAVTHAPINGIFDHQLGLGIVGGRLYQSSLVGKEAGDIAIRILRGEPASSFPPRLIEPLPPRYDWRELQRWKINEKLLPKGSTVVHRAPTLWQEHRNLILGVLILCGVQAALIAGLLVNLFRRRRAEVSLGESEERFQTMADAAPVLMWMSGEDKLCTFFNKAWLEFTGRTAEQEFGDGWVEGVHPDDLAKTVATYRAAFDARKPFAIQYRLQRHDGEYRSIADHGVPRYGPRGNFRGYVGTCVDITDLLKKETALREIEERTALAAEAAQLGVWELDKVTNQLWVSDKMRELFQFDGEGEVTYAMLQERVHPEDRPVRESAIRRAIETKAGYELEYRLLLPDGAQRWIGGRARCIDHGDGNPLRLIGVAIDVTERKKAEEAARHQREQINLLSRVSLLGEMTASLAHELNQPLAAIITNANAGMRFIDRGGEQDLTTLHEILADVVEDGRRAHGIIQNVRNTVKKGDPTGTQINLNELIAKVVYVVRPDAVACSCEVETSLSEDLPLIEGDPIQIQQVLVNLVSNAFDAMGHTPLSRRKLQIGTASDDGKVHVSFRDHGTGIPPDVRERLFDQFFTTKAQGLGMGLAIVRSIVEAHGGEIEAENVPDGGARFSFTLPVIKR